MSNFKKLVESRMAKTGESWSTAARHVRAHGSAPIEAPSALAAPTDATEALIASLRATHVSSILVGRAAAIGSSATYQEAARQARVLQENPAYFARSAHVQMHVTLDQLQALAARGATEEYAVQRIKVFSTGHGPTFSVPCAACERWIHCGSEPGSGECVCDQRFEVSFDGPEDWSLPQGWLCMNCGEPFEMKELGQSRSPWHAMNGHQQACDVCFHMLHVGAWWVRKRADERRASNSAEGDSMKSGG